MITQKIPTVPRLVSLKNAARLVKNPIPVVQEMMKKMGPTYFFHIGGRTMGMITQDLDIIQHILQKNHNNYYKSPLQSKELAAYVGKGLLTNNGPDWLRQRRMIQPLFSKQKVNSIAEIMESEFARVFGQEIINEERINLSHLSAMLTFHIVAKSIFSDGIGHEEIVRMRDHVERVQKMLILQVRQPYKKWFYTWSGMIKKHHRLAQEAKDLIHGLIVTRSKASSPKKNDILQFMLDSRYEDTGKPMSEQQLIDELLILIVAGHETTAHSLTWTVYLLNHHPEILADVLTEINYKNTSYFDYFNPDSLLLATIKESMRLYPPAWVIDRVGLDDDELETVTIPKDTILMNFVYGLHHNSNYWENPEQFFPKRFISNPRPEAYFPFGAGPRLCIGNHFALLELVVVLVNLLKNYELPSTPLSFPGFNPLITLQPAKPIWLNLSKRMK